MSKKNKVKEKWIAPYVTPGIAKHLQTHRQATHRMGCSCALFVFDETWRFQSQSTAFGLLRGYLAAAKLRIFPEWITIIPRKSHICSLKLSFFLFQKLKMNSVNGGLCQGDHSNQTLSDHYACHSRYPSHEQDLLRALWTNHSFC